MSTPVVSQLDSAFDTAVAEPYALPVPAAAESEHAGPLRSKLSSINYPVRAPLVAWLEREAGKAADSYGRYRMLDVGCGIKPYYPLFAEHADAYVGVDVARGGGADLIGSADSIPVADGSFDVVLCSQVLEHCLDPGKVIAELRRVVAPGGRVLLSTHGTQVYHPAPHDLWRWTHAGLAHLFQEHGNWSSVRVEPGSGPAACIGMLLSIYIDLIFKRAHVRFLGKPIIALVNGMAKLADRLVGNSLRPGTIHANYHVVAEA